MEHPHELDGEGMEHALLAFQRAVDILVSELRQSRLPVEAQAIENRTASEWDRCFQMQYLRNTYQVLSVEQLRSVDTTELHAGWVLFQLFNWEDSPEGDRWRLVHTKMNRHLDHDQD